MLQLPRPQAGCLPPASFAGQLAGICGHCCSQDQSLHQHPPGAALRIIHHGETCCLTLHSMPSSPHHASLPALHVRAQDSKEWRCLLEEPLSAARHCSCSPRAVWRLLSALQRSCKLAWAAPSATQASTFRRSKLRACVTGGAYVAAARQGAPALGDRREVDEQASLIILTDSILLSKSSASCSAQDDGARAS